MKLMSLTPTGGRGKGLSRLPLLHDPSSHAYIISISFEMEIVYFLDLKYTKYHSF